MTNTTITTNSISTVETVRFSRGQQIDQISRKFGAFNFGTIGPGETSETIITTLWFNAAKAISNIKLGLIDTGGITFANDIFRITTSPAYDDDIIPTSYFLGVNSNGSASNEYNIAIDNLSGKMSEYVYLNINLPRNANYGAGVVRFKWFFDYDD